MPGYLPPNFYAGPADPLVSPDFRGWWSRSFRLVQTAWRPMALIQIASVLPLTVVSIVAQLLLGTDIAAVTTSADPDLNDIDWSGVGGTALILLPFFLVAIVISLATDLATTHYLVQKVTGRPPSIGTAFARALRRVPALIGWSLLAGLLVLVGVLFCILPGIYIGAVMTTLPVIVLLERTNAISRAFQLFHADLGASIGRVATFFGLTLGLGLLESIVTGIFTNGSPAFSPEGVSPTVVVISQLVSALFSIANGVVFAPMILCAYADLRARREPFSTAYLTPAT